MNEKICLETFRVQTAKNLRQRPPGAVGVHLPDSVQDLDPPHRSFHESAPQPDPGRPNRRRLPKTPAM